MNAESSFLRLFMFVRVLFLLGVAGSVFAARSLDRSRAGRSSTGSRVSSFGQNQLVRPGEELAVGKECRCQTGEGGRADQHIHHDHL